MLELSDLYRCLVDAPLRYLRQARTCAPASDLGRLGFCRALPSRRRPTRTRLPELRSPRGVLPRCPRVVLVRMQNARDLLLQLRRPARLGHGNGVFEKLLLDRSRQIHSTAGARPPQGAAGYAPLLLRGPWAGGGRVLAVLPQEHLLRSPSGEGAGQRIARARLPFLWCPGVHPTQYGILERLPATSEGGAMWPAPERQ